MSKNQDDGLYCSFCEKHRSEVDQLISGPGVFICNECVELCYDIINKNDIEEVEDDEYYYYVKAVPKMNVSTADKKVKHIQPKASAKNKGK